jgi:hypothetical protein
MANAKATIRAIIIPPYRSTQQGVSGGINEKQGEDHAYKSEQPP